jgi:hypothetical protein
MNKSNCLTLEIEAVANKSFFETIKEMVVCVICTGIIIDPSQCENCENTFCKICIDKWLTQSQSCPYKCKEFSIKNSCRTIKNLLEKLTFKCPFLCNLDLEYSYTGIIKHLKICTIKKTFCYICNSLVYSSQIKNFSEFQNLKNKIEILEEENFRLLSYNSKLQDEIKNLKLEIKRENPKHRNGTKAIQTNYDTTQNANIIQDALMNKFICNDNALSFNFLNSDPSSHAINTGLIDKCEHFKGNYMPIFECCNNPYPCYLCHNEMQDHPYHFSNKVICLICNNTYSGNQCNECLVKQVYKKKS